MGACPHPYTIIKRHGGWVTVICGKCKALLSQQKEK
jgi:hypothetical protein